MQKQQEQRKDGKMVDEYNGGGAEYGGGPNVNADFRSASSSCSSSSASFARVIVVIHINQPLVVLPLTLEQDSPNSPSWPSRLGGNWSAA